MQVLKLVTGLRVWSHVRMSIIRQGRARANVHSSTDSALRACTPVGCRGGSHSAFANATRLKPPKSMFSAISDGRSTAAPADSSFCSGSCRFGGPPRMSSSTFCGSGTSVGGELLICTRRPEPLGRRPWVGRLEVDEVGDSRDSDEERGLTPERWGSGVRYGRRLGAGE